MKTYQTEFMELALEHEVLKFGQFTLKSGRVSPYFFNLGKISTGSALARLADAYAEALVASGISFDMLFGPAYKGIPLVAAVAVSTSSTITTRPRGGAPTIVPPSPCVLASLRL